MSRSRFIWLPLVAASTASFSIPPQSAHAQARPGFDLSVANIMRGPEHYGREPQNVSWSPDGQWIYFQWAPAGSKWDEPTRLYRVRPVAGATPERVSDAAADSISPMIAPGVTSLDGRLRVTSTRGDLHLIDLQRFTVRRLTETAGAETSPLFSNGNTHVLYMRDGNAYALELASGALKQLTDVRAGPAPRDSAVPTGMRGALVRDQRDLLEVIRDRARVDSIQRVEREAAEARQRLRPVYLPAGERLATISVAPSMKSAVVLTASNPPGQPRIAQVPNYVTSSGFTEDIATRTKVGDGNVRFRAYHLDFATNRLQPLWVTGGDSTRAASQIRVVGWNDAGNTALLQSGTPDFKWRYYSSVTDAGQLRAIDGLRDSAWVGGPCGGCAGWLPDGRAYFVSEASGYAHLYTANADGSAKQALTSGNWEVLQVDLSPDRRTFWLHTSEESPFVRHFYRMAITGGARTKVTREHGGHQIAVSPTGRQLADVFSQANMPPELFVTAADGSAPVKLTTSTSEEFRRGPWIKPEIVHITASDGVRVPARIYKPSDMSAQPNGAAVIFVHGAGYLHNVHDWWSTYSREYMFHHLLASKGYIVLDVDYRASAGYGRDWRTAIYRWMGGRDLADHVDASRWLQKEHRIDPERIGIYGGSYGGFMTLMALFNAPKEFGAGAALRSVTDWAHYNHGYTGSILNLPQDDTLAYRRSSPIFFAQNLEDPLLMAHGMVDTNVHFQDIVRLTQRLIELGKTNWELAVYPVEDHGFTRPSSWTDEYNRILDLFERVIGPNGSKARR